MLVMICDTGLSYVGLGFTQELENMHVKPEN